MSIFLFYCGFCGHACVGNWVNFFAHVMGFLLWFQLGVCGQYFALINGVKLWCLSDQGSTISRGFGVFFVTFESGKLNVLRWLENLLEG